MTMTTERAPGREHIPRYTRGFITIRILQFILAIICLGLMAYTIALLAFSGNCLMLFTSIVTVGATLYMIVTMSCVPKSYNYWAVLALDIFLTIFWLVSFALLAVQAAWYFAASAWWYGYGADWYDSDSYDYDYDSYYDDIYSDSYDYDYKRGIEKRDLSGTALTYGAILGTAAGLGALNFLFFLISLIIHSCVTFRHRRAGLHSKPLAAGAATTPSAPHNPNYAPAPQQQPQTYSAPYGQPPMGQVPPQQGYYVPQQQQQQQQQYYAPAPSHGTPQGSPIVSPGSVSKTSSPQPQPAYAAYQPPHDGSHEVAGYPPQGNPTNQ